MKVREALFFEDIEADELVSNGSNAVFTVFLVPDPFKKKTTGGTYQLISNYNGSVWFQGSKPNLLLYLTTNNFKPHK